MVQALYDTGKPLARLLFEQGEKIRSAVSQHWKQGFQRLLPQEKNS